MTDQTENAKLWTPRSGEDTKALYADWANTYDSDLAKMAYATPDRVARALIAQGPDLSAPVLDFGCGTGLSGLALRQHGFEVVDGTDITPQMLDLAGEKKIDGHPVYRRLWQGTADDVAVGAGDYAIIVATGVISLGAGPPGLLHVLLRALRPGGLLAFSYNDPTLQDPEYIAALDAPLARGDAQQLFREHGPHLSEKVTGADVIILRRV